MKFLGIILIAFCLSLGGCNSKNKNIDLDKEHLEDSKDYKFVSSIEKLIDNEEYSEALAESKRFHEIKTPSKYTQEVNYYSARASEGLKDLNTALTGYREIIRNSITPENVKNKSLYRQSFVYEALGQDEKVVATLLDLQKSGLTNQDQIFLAEVPARLAIIYARLGNHKLSESYYAEAEAGIKKLQAKQAAEVNRKWLPKTLYFMGNLSAREIREKDFEASIRPLEKAQSFLLRVVTMNDEVWSKKASDELYKIYKDIILAISNVKLPENPDEEVAQKEAQAKKWSMATMALESLKNLKLAWDSAKDIPQEDKKNFMTFLDLQEKELGVILEETPVTSRLTPEAQKRQGLKRSGRIEGPDPMMEEPPKVLPKKAPKQ